MGKEAGAHGRDAKALDAHAEERRRQIAEERAQADRRHAEEMAKQNKEYEARLKEAGAHGRDAKALDAHAEEMAKQHKEYEARLREARSRVDPHAEEQRRQA